MRVGVLTFLDLTKIETVLQHFSMKTVITSKSCSLISHNAKVKK